MEYERRRTNMVARQLGARGIRDSRVLGAMGEVPREAFVPEESATYAYEDRPLPIGGGQTISQPYIVARMIEAAGVRPGDRVLEIGTGSGYGAAVLSRIASEVYTVERIGSHARAARERLRRLGLDNVHVKHGDGRRGWPEHAPYDAVVLTAAAPEVPEAVVDQLATPGRLVAPLGRDPEHQELLRITKTREGLRSVENLGGVRFVPLLPGVEPA